MRVIKTLIKTGECKIYEYEMMPYKRKYMEKHGLNDIVECPVCCCKFKGICSWQHHKGDYHLLGVKLREEATEPIEDIQQAIIAYKKQQNGVALEERRKKRFAEQQENLKIKK